MTPAKHDAAEIFAAPEESCFNFLFEPSDILRSCSRLSSNIFLFDETAAR